MTSLLFFVSVCRTWFREQSCSLTGIRQLDRVQQPLTVTLNYFAWNTEMWPNSATSNSTYFFFDINFWLLPEQIVTNHPPIGITGLAATFHWLQNPVELIWLVLAHWNTPICHWVRQQFFFAALARSGVVIYVVAEPNYSRSSVEYGPSDRVQRRGQGDRPIPAHFRRLFLSTRGKELL